MTEQMNQSTTDLIT